jgi:hypothetical protein
LALKASSWVMSIQRVPCFVGMTMDYDDH